MARKKADKKADEATVVHNATQTLVKKVLGFCHTLRDDGVGASEYLEQLTYLLFLKMIDDRSPAALGDFVDWLKAFSEKEGIEFIISVSGEAEEADERVKACFI